jgi:UDP-N-acetylmuramate dehydrogenase
MNLSELTTMRVGGPVATLLQPASRSELVDAALEAWASGEGWFLLGGGSNVVAPDAGYDGTVVLTTGVRGIEPIAADDGRVHLRVAAGEPWDEVVAFAVSRGLAGIEALSGIPGSAGAAPVQNIGAYGQEVAQVLVSVDFLDESTGTVSRLPASQLDLGYRTSAIKRGRLGAILSIELALTPDHAGQVAMPQLADALGVPAGSRVALDAVRDAVIALRASKGMLEGPGFPPSCGSFFMNPIVDENWARSLPADAPRWPVGPEEADIASPLADGPRLREYPSRRDVKLSAAWLIEHAGIPRGYALPGSRAAVSERHALSIVNRGGASAAEVVQLAEFIQLRVSSDFGVVLQPEPVVL